MVAVLRVCNLHAGFPFWFLTIVSARPLGTFRTLLEEIRHKVHLQRRGKERLRGDKKRKPDKIAGHLENYLCYRDWSINK